MSTIVRWNPIREMAAMQSAMDRLFEDTWRGSRPAFNGATLPLDVHETDNTYKVVANLPGVKAEDVNVSIHEGILTIAAEFVKPEVDENTRVHVQERVHGKFSRSITLPQEVVSDDVEAAFENGILTLTLPKAPQAQPRQIPVRAHNGTLASQN